MDTDFAPENELERALLAAASDPAARPAFYRTLMDADVYVVPVGEMPQMVDGVVAVGTQIALHNLSANGVNYTPFFSSVLRVRQWIQEEMHWLSLPARSLLQLTAGARLLLNPGQSYGKEFLPDEVMRLLNGTMFSPQEQYTPPADVQILIGQPAQYPQELVDALRRVFAALPAVKRAWLAQYVNPARDSDPGLLLCVETDGRQPWQQVIGDAGVVAQNVPRTHKFIDFVQYTGTGTTGYFNNQPPFYQRSLLRGLLR